MTDIPELFRRQAEWQKSLRQLSWPEKLQMAARVRDSVVKFSRLRASADKTAIPEDVGQRGRPDPRKNPAAE